jgi:hypothetical protein
MRRSTRRSTITQPCVQAESRQKPDKPGYLERWIRLKCQNRARLSFKMIEAMALARIRQSATYNDLQAGRGFEKKD